MSREEEKAAHELAPGSARETLAVDLPVVDPKTGHLQSQIGSKVDEALVGKEKIELGIDWDSIDKNSLFASLEKYDNAENTHTEKLIGNRGHRQYVLHQAELSTRSGEKLVLEVSKVISPNFHELQIGITRPSIPEDQDNHVVAAFDFLQLKKDGEEEWDMKHRKTEPAYRKQGIGEKILELTGEILQERSRANNLSQSVSSSAIQKDVIYWLENRGFGPATPEDADNLKRLKEGDSSLVDISKDGETYTVDWKSIENKFKELCF